jgi:adenosylmethionine-8-amino-7-oxononanoate aminotransferase
VQAARERNIPVIYDEIFTGCWRLGPPTAGHILQEAPDIACYAKLLTGGVAPLAVTLASEAVFDAFKGDSKVSLRISTQWRGGLPKQVPVGGVPGLAGRGPKVHLGA